MILVRTEFQCQSGRTQEAVDLFKAQIEQGLLASDQVTTVKRTRILTDLSGRFDTLILEQEVESIDAYLAMLQAMFVSPEFQEAQAALAGDNPIQTGSRTFYTIEATYE